MPRATSTKNKPGTERYRDERRDDPNPKMHGRQWHDHDQPKALDPEPMAGLDAAPEVESSGERAGFGRLRKESPTSAGRVRRKRTTPVSKGPKKKTREAQGSHAGMKSRGRSGNPG